MAWSALRTWYDDLEPGRAWRWIGAAALGAALLVPWRRTVAVEAAVRAREGQTYPLLAPGPGRVREVRAEKDKVLEPGAVVLTYVPTADPSPFAPSPWSATATAAYLDDERRIRENYQRQIQESYGYITSIQQQLNRAWSEQRPRIMGGVSYEVQLAQNALERARAVPGELSRKMEQELASLRRQREDQTRPAGTVAAGWRVPAGAEEVPVRVDERVQVVAVPAAAGSQLTAGKECAVLLPEGATMAVLAAVPAAQAGDLRAGMPATLEVNAWLDDAQAVPLVLEKVGNRRLEPAEVAALSPKAPQDQAYVLITCAPVRDAQRLFPPPGGCRVNLAGLRRCLLQRWLF